MTKRLQVLLEDNGYREGQRAARARNLTMAAWVREALDAARRREPYGDVTLKFESVRTAVQRACPTAGIDETNAEIERGYHAPD